MFGLASAAPEKRAKMPNIVQTRFAMKPNHLVIPALCPRSAFIDLSPAERSHEIVTEATVLIDEAKLTV
jgi:hypothetical protein